jgi:hypothetical protein
MRSGSRGGAVFVNEPTESISAADPERIGGSGEAQSRSRLWRRESQATVRTVAVVVIDVGVQDALELARAGVEDITTPEEQLKRMRGERGSGPGRDAVDSADIDLPSPP